MTNHVAELSKKINSGDQSVPGKVLGIVMALITAAIGVAMLYVSDYLVAYVMLYLNLDWDIYPGVFSFGSSLISIAFLFILSRAEGFVTRGEKKHLIKFNKIEGIDIVAAFTIAMALLAIVTTYMLIATLISQYLESFNKAIEEYAAAVDTYTPEKEHYVWDQILYILSITFLVPISEEFAFRGVVFGAFNRRLNAAWAIGISAAIFGILHGVSIHIGYALLSGVIIGICYYAFDSIFVTILIHAFFNFAGSAVIELCDVLGIPSSSVPSFYSLKFLLIVPAGFFIAKKIESRRKNKKMFDLEAIVDEQA